MARRHNASDECRALRLTMVDKSKMSVADMLAAARKTDSQGAAPSEKTAPAATSSEPQAKPAPKASAPAAVAKPTSAGGKPSVADILAMARANKVGDSAVVAPAAPKETAKAAAKPAA